MILSDATLNVLLQSGELQIDPLAPDAIQPGSVDCRLGRHFLTVDGDAPISIDAPVRYHETESDHMMIPPGQFLLATTMEWIKLPPNLSAFVEGRSSIGRIGLFIQNAGWVDAGFEGSITLELFNANTVPIQLTAGRRICQLVFCRMDQAALNPYRGKYQGQRVTTGSLIHMDSDR